MRGRNLLSGHGVTLELHDHEKSGVGDPSITPAILDADHRPGKKAAARKSRRVSGLA
jgi:hypothetical protein